MTRSDVKKEAKTGGGSDGAAAEEVSIIRCDTTSGPFTMKLIRSWSPLGYDRAKALFRLGYYDHSHFYRVVPNFLIQFGIGYTRSETVWDLANAEELADDPQLDPPVPFEEGTVAFAGSGNNTRHAELFIAFDEKKERFGKKNHPWETPIGKVIDGMDVLKNLYSGYGDVTPIGNGPDQMKIHSIGRSYPEEEFPLLDHFKRCTVEQEGGATASNDINNNRKKQKEQAEEAKDAVVGGRATAEIRKMASSMTLKEGVLLDDGLQNGYKQKVPLTGRGGMKRQKISAYRDHHDNVQATEGTGWSALFALMIMVLLVWLSFVISRGGGRRGRRSKAL